ncbi:MAG: MoaD/ThiS family protein [Spirochaetes bacterium]|nr:MoaD/ThiS family protein [Spirochaetota bacterium]
MNIIMYYPAAMRIDNVKSGSIMDIPEGTNIEALLKSCNVKKEHMKYILAYVNGEKRGMSHRLRRNDELKLYLPVGGG